MNKSKNYASAARCSEDTERKAAAEQEEIAEYANCRSQCNNGEEKLALLHEEVLEYMQRMDVNCDQANYRKIRCKNAERRIAVLLHDETDYGLNWRNRCKCAENNVQSLSEELEEYKLRLAKKKRRELKCTLNVVIFKLAHFCFVKLKASKRELQCVLESSVWVFLSIESPLHLIGDLASV